MASLHLLDGQVDTKPSPRRYLPALSLSLGTHAAGAVVLLLLVTGRTVPSAAPAASPQSRSSVSWVVVTPASGGGREAGNRSPAPAAPMRTRGNAARSMPASAPPSIEARERPDEPPLVAPVVLQPVASGLDEVAGLLTSSALASLPPGGPGAGPGGGTGQRGGPGPGSGPGADAGPPGAGGLVPPQLLRQVPPQYTSRAMAARIQGVVAMEAVVLTDGTVGDIRIVRSLDRAFGLDAAAIDSVRKWKFVPGTRLGQPQPMLVTIELTFSLR